MRPQLEDRAGVPRVPHVEGYLSVAKDGGKTLYVATEGAGEYTALFTQMYRKLFDTVPGFKL